MHKKIFLFLLLTSLTLAACKNQTATPTEDSIAAIYTEAASTLNAGATLTAAFATPTFTETATATITPTGTSTLPPTSTTISTTVYSGGSNLSSCDVAAFVSDVTIPDGTAVTPGQTFTKTWRIRNDGTCTWNANYKIVYYSGERLNTEASYPLTTVNVAPGENLDISVQMVAPTQAGDYISNWVLQNSSGQYFGIGTGGGVVYVQFVVSGTSSTSTATSSAAPSQTTAPTATDTIEPSPTATPE